MFSQTSNKLNIVYETHLLPFLESDTSFQMTSTKVRELFLKKKKLFPLHVTVEIHRKIYRFKVLMTVATSLKVMGKCLTGSSTFFLATPLIPPLFFTGSIAGMEFLGRSFHIPRQSISREIYHEFYVRLPCTLAKKIYHPQMLMVLIKSLVIGYLFLRLSSYIETKCDFNRWIARKRILAHDCTHRKILRGQHL